MAAADGGVFAYGNAQSYGSMGGRSLASPNYGSAANIKLAAPVVGIWTI